MPMFKYTMYIYLYCGKMEMKKPMLIIAVVCSAMLLATSIVAPVVNAQPMLKAEEQKQQYLETQQQYVAMADKINSVIRRAEGSNITSQLHDIFMAIWDIISIVFGHNILTRWFVMLITIWFFLPLVAISDIGSFQFNVSTTFWARLQQRWDEIDVDGLWNSLGLMGFFILPVVFCYVVICALGESVRDGFDFNIEGGILQKIINDLNYIYRPYDTTKGILPYPGNWSLTGASGKFPDRPVLNRFSQLSQEQPWYHVFYYKGLLGVTSRLMLLLCDSIASSVRERNATPDEL